LNAGGRLLHSLRVLATALLLAACAVHSVRAAPTQWRGGLVDLRASDEPLAAFLLRFFAKQQVGALVSPAIGEAKISGVFRKPAFVVLNELAATYGFVWYHFAGTIYVSALSENQERLLPLEPDGGVKMATVLRELGIADERFTARYSRDSAVFVVSGPPKYVDLVEQTVKRLDGGGAGASFGQVRVYRLKHSWADDRTVSIANTDTLIPGVASLIRGMLAEAMGSVPGQGNVRAAPPTATRLPGARGSSGSGNSAPGPVGSAPSSAPLTGFATLLGRGAPATQVARPAAKDSEPGSGALPAGESPNGTVRADPRLNAVIVRDMVDRLAFYDELIKQLDQPSPLIEIEATVVDVSSGESSSLGLDFTGLLSNRSERINAPVITASAEALAAGTAPRGSIVLGSNRALLLARINALEGEGKAAINTRPRVVTLDNVEAVLQSTQEFYVRVSGRDAGDLFKVEAGLVLRVTPSAVIDGDTVQYRLLVRIDDGSVSSRVIDGLPSVSRSSISASVTINEGESLFIGGLVSESSTNDSNGVPFFSKLPILRPLFGTRSSDVRKSERLFLITPRLVKPT
jgi:type III secretion protein C